MLDLDEIEARALHVGEHGFYPNSHLSAGKILCDVTALIAELRKLREENARLQDLLAEWHEEGCCTPSDEMFAEARYIAERRKGRS